MFILQELILMLQRLMETSFLNARKDKAWGVCKRKVTGNYEYDLEGEVVENEYSNLLSLSRIFLAIPVFILTALGKKYFIAALIVFIVASLKTYLTD